MASGWLSSLWNRKDSLVALALQGAWPPRRIASGRLFMGGNPRKSANPHRSAGLQANEISFGTAINSALASARARTYLG